MLYGFRFTIRNKKIRDEAKQNSKGYKSQTLLTHAERCDEVVAFLPAFKKQTIVLEDEIMVLKTNKKLIKNKTEELNGKWIEETRAKQLRKCDENGLTFLWD